MTTTDTQRGADGEGPYQSVQHSDDCQHERVVMIGDTIMICESQQLPGPSTFVGSQPPPITTTLTRTTHVGGGKTRNETHTFAHEPMEMGDGVVCKACRMVVNGDLYCVPWPCAVVRDTVIRERAARLVVNAREADRDGHPRFPGYLDQLEAEL
jgi:hypothetical protein